MRTYASLFILGFTCACTGGVEYSKLSRLSAEISAAPGTVDFGEVVKLYSVTSSVEILNSGSGSLEIYGAELKINDRYVDTFTVDGLDDLGSIPSGGSASLEVTFNPSEYTDYNARLDIESNSGFDYEDNGDESKWDAEAFHFLEIPITGAGVKGSTPDISVPGAIDFADPEDGGNVDLGEEVTQTLTIRNTGDGTLNIVDVELPEGPFSLVYELDDLAIAEGSEFNAPIKYAPTGGDAGSVDLVIHSTDPDEAEVSVRLVGNGNYERPIARIDCDSLAANTPPRTVILDGRESDDPEDTEQIHELEYEWVLLDRPELSRTSIRNPTEPLPELFLDVAGIYTIGLHVTDWNGIVSEQEVCEADIKPNEELYVAMSWDTPNSDLDLHMVPEGESMWECYDCSWCNPSPDWPSSYGNPVYALDNTSGYGPENINVRSPGALRYYIRAHYWSDSGGGETRATMSIYILGELVETLTESMNSRDRWDVGYVSFTESEDGTLSGVFVEDGSAPYSQGGSCADC